MFVTATQDFVVILGEAIRRRRRGLKLKQADVGKLIGVSQQTIARWEGGGSIDEDYALKIADFLDHDEESVVACFNPLMRARMVADGSFEIPTGADLEEERPRHRAASSPTDAAIFSRLQAQDPDTYQLIERLAKKALGES